jgi:hypothetical protein
MESPNPKPAIGGIKLSQELIQIRLFPESDRILQEMFSSLTAVQINLTGVTLEMIEGKPEARCCISAEDRVDAETALKPFYGSFDLLTGIGTVTIYPHQGRLELLGRLLSILGKVKLPIYGVASSFSSLVIATDYERLDEAVEMVCQVVSLPENHAPFRPEFRVRQL